MPQPLIVSIPHSLGKDEAIRRLKSGLSVVEANFGTLFSVQEQTWQGDRLFFRISALGQPASPDISHYPPAVDLFCERYFRFVSVSDIFAL
jgi:hypothetical protein